MERRRDEPERVDVLVVGAGLGGLSTTMFLAMHGVNVLCVERHPSTAIHPRASGQNPRTMELFAQAGIAEEVLGASGRASQGLRVTVAASLTGQVYHQLVENTDDLDLSAVTPRPWGMAGQEVVEPILLSRAEKLGASVRFDTELVSFTQDEHGVRAVLRHRGSELEPAPEQVIEAAYLVAADGARSRIREQLGIETHGVGAIGHLVGSVFEADLGDRLRPALTDLYYLRQERFSGALINTDFPGRFVFAVDYRPQDGESPEDFTHARLTELIRLATDLPELEPVIRSSAPWEMAARIAGNFRSGRVFLAGDAAKVTPPTGGMGGNTAVGDGHDLAWKLASVLRGEAGEGLLDTYQAERAPIAEMVVATSLHNAKQRMAPELDTSDLPAPVDPIWLAMGFRYRSSAVLAEPGDTGAAPADPVETGGRAGFRAPHVPVLAGATEQSTVDFLGHGWVLLAGDRGEGWRAAADTLAGELGLRLECRVLGADFTDPRELFHRRYGLDAGGASLIRPDGVVAWRSPGAEPDPEGTLRQVLRQLLSR